MSIGQWEDSDEAAILDKLIDVERATVEAQLDSAGDDANKAIAVLTLVVALVAGLAGARLADPHLTAWWWLPMVGLGLAAGCLIRALWPVLITIGPDTDALYKLTYGKARPDAFRDILGAITAVFEENEKTLSKDTAKSKVEDSGFRTWARAGRTRWYIRGLQAFVVTLILGAILLPVLTLTLGTAWR